MPIVNPKFTVWLGYVSNPVTTAVYLERALRKICRVITVGPTMPVELYHRMGIRHELRPLDIETSFTPDMKVLPGTLPEEFQPDLYLWVDSVARFTHLPQNLDALSCPKACYLIDSHFAPDYYRQYSSHFDYVFVAQLQVLDFFRQTNQHSYWLPLACDPEIHRDFGIERIHPVGFVGGMNANRERLLTEISSVASVRYESCFLEDMARVFSASRIGFNHASLDDLNMRFFELPSTGALQLFSQTNGSGQEQLFKDGEDIAIYTEDTIGEIVRYYLQNESLCTRIADRGKMMVHNAHTYDHRVADLLNVIANGKHDTSSPDELRLRSLGQVPPLEPMIRPAHKEVSLTTTDGAHNQRNSLPHIETIVSNRDRSSWPSWLMVHEWEDILSKTLSAKIVTIGDWSESQGATPHANEYELCFMQLADNLERFIGHTRLIPVVMDLWEHDIAAFMQRASSFPLVFVTSLAVFNRLRDLGCNQVAYLPYSFPDQYLLDHVPRKDIDIIQFGRTNPVLDGYMVQLLHTYPHLNYVTTVHQNGKIYFHSSRNGLLEASDTRQKFMAMLGRSTISLVSTAGMDGSRDTGGFDPVSPRFYESAAGYCRLVGRFPQNSEFEYFGINRIAEHVSSYQQFETTVMGYIGKEFDRTEEYQEILKSHTTSSRAVLIENAVRRIHGLRTNGIRSRM